MAVTQDKPGPYAPTTAVMAIVERYRDRGLPTPVTTEVLERAGVPESLSPRTFYSLQTLDLIDTAGNPTQALDSIKLAPQAEYQTRLGEWLNAAYADILAFVDPATADETAVHDAFRSYNPAGQRGRMVTLFMGLFRAAGIMPEKTTGAPIKKKSTSLRPTARAATSAKPKPKEIGGSAGVQTPKLADFNGQLPPPIAGLLVSLPTHGEGWTKAERDAFMSTFAVVVDFVFPPGAIKRKAEAEDEANA